MAQSKVLVSQMLGSQASVFTLSLPASESSQWKLQTSSIQLHLNTLTRLRLLEERERSLERLEMEEIEQSS